MGPMKRTVDRQTWGIVTDLACDIANASIKDDAAGGRKAYQRLKAFVDERTRQHKSHPWFLETLADFTADNRRAISLYRRALGLANRAGLPKHTLLLELGRRHLNVRGKRAVATRYLASALAEAKRRRAHDSSVEAEALLKEAHAAP